MVRRRRPDPSGSPLDAPHEGGLGAGDGSDGGARQNGPGA
jgi:hypothetical protein